jgi:hypothetical protein
MYFQKGPNGIRAEAEVHPEMHWKRKTNVEIYFFAAVIFFHRPLNKKYPS